MKFRKYNSRSAKSSPETIALIRKRYHEDGWSQGKLSREFGYSVVQIGRIVRNESWQGLSKSTALPPPDPISEAHAEMIPIPDDVQARLLADLANLDSEVVPKADDPIDAYLKRSKGEGSNEL
jgi:hypothetical protein